jgi:hypothetical protein
VSSGNYQQSGALVIFTPSKPIYIPLPFPMRSFVYAPDGKSIYAQSMATGACLDRVDFNPTRTNSVACPNGLQFQSLAISPSEDKLLFSGSYTDQGGRFCGLFAVLLPDRRIQPILKAECAPKLPWTSLSLAPDGNMAVAVYHRRFEVQAAFAPYSVVIIDLGSGKERSLGAEFATASWSPDGRWIAALERKEEGKTVLFDAQNFARVKTLPASEAQWSPDSRYLLRVKPCKGEDGTAEALDVVKGTSTPFPSSRCEIYNVSTGWVSNRILPPKLGGH